MAVYAFDGTWQDAKTVEDPSFQNTNVFHFYQAYHKHSGKNDRYIPGVGTRFDLVGKTIGGAFGLGELPRLLTTYDELCQNWIDGDHDIDIVGFSRGAATTLDFIHLIQERGIRHPGTNTVVEPKPCIRFLGVWDVVAAFGPAFLGNTALNVGHHISLPKERLQFAFHAMALDERRPSFLNTRLPGAHEVWFRGVHSDVGGGNENPPLNLVTLRWMLRKAKAAQLPIVDGDIPAAPAALSEPHPRVKLPVPIRLISAVDRRHHSVAPLHGWVTPPATCPVESDTDEGVAQEVGAGGLEVLPEDLRPRALLMWETAQAVAAANDVRTDWIREPLMTLIEGRVVLVTNEQQLHDACASVRRLMAVAIEGMHERGFHDLQEFFFNEALFKLPRLFPLTD